MFSWFTNNEAFVHKASQLDSMVQSMQQEPSLYASCELLAST